MLNSVKYEDQKKIALIQELVCDILLLTGQDSTYVSGYAY